MYEMATTRQCFKASLTRKKEKCSALGANGFCMLCKTVMWLFKLCKNVPHEVVAAIDPQSLQTIGFLLVFFTIWNLILKSFKGNVLTVPSNLSESAFRMRIRITAGNEWGSRYTDPLVLVWVHTYEIVDQLCRHGRGPNRGNKPPTVQCFKLLKSYINFWNCL